MENTELVPSLAPPGAGLPRVELFFARLIFNVSRRFSNHSNALSDFANRRDEILQLVHGIDPVAGAKPILINRLPGLEDSSRYWSVFMTVEHLRLVHESVAGVMATLLDGKRPPGVVSTADVKPVTGIDGSVVPAFVESCRKLEKLVSDAPDLKTEMKFSHPWFGPLDADGWFFMAGFHLNLHRRQIERIQAALYTGK